MTLPATVSAAASGVTGFDADSVIPLDTARQFASQGYRFCVRYLSLGAGEDPGDLSPQEAGNILAAGLALMPVQHVRDPGWLPTAAMGQGDGASTVANAQAVGFPAGVNVWCDLEGVGSAASAQDVCGYCGAWYSAVSAAGYVPGLYVGSDAVLTGPQLYDLPFQHYWQSCSAVPAIPVRGYQLVQTLVEAPVNGIGIDHDVTRADSLGGQALWLVT
jgi:hypothetical protein